MQFFIFCSYHSLITVRELCLVSLGEIFRGWPVFRDFWVIQQTVYENCTFLSLALESMCRSIKINAAP